MTEQELRDEFGSEKVDNVKMIVMVSDPDFAYTMFEDAEDEDACTIVQELYFDENSTYFDRLEY